MHSHQDSGNSSFPNPSRAFAEIAGVVRQRAGSKPGRLFYGGDLFQQRRNANLRELHGDLHDGRHCLNRFLRWKHQRI
jgi:hypothetical protein